MRKFTLLFVFGALMAQNILFSLAKINVDSLTTVLNSYQKEGAIKAKMLVTLCEQPNSKFRALEQLAIIKQKMTDGILFRLSFFVFRKNSFNSFTKNNSF